MGIIPPWIASPLSNPLVRFIWGLEPRSRVRFLRSLATAILPSLLLFATTLFFAALILNMATKPLATSPGVRWNPTEQIGVVILMGGLYCVVLLNLWRPFHSSRWRRGSPRWDELLLAGFGEREICVAQASPALLGLILFSLVYTFPHFVDALWPERESAFTSLDTFGVYGSVLFLATYCTLFDSVARAIPKSWMGRILLGVFMGSVTSPYLWAITFYRVPNIYLLVSLEVLSWPLRIIYPAYLWRKVARTKRRMKDETFA